MCDESGISERWVDEHEASQITGMSISWFQQARCRGEGIPYTKLDRACRYKLSDVRAFMNARTRSSSDKRDKPLTDFDPLDSPSAEWRRHEITAESEKGRVVEIAEHHQRIARDALQRARCAFLEIVEDTALSARERWQEFVAHVVGPFGEFCHRDDISEFARGKIIALFDVDRQVSKRHEGRGKKK